jgi:hypothetical protein
MLRTGRTTGRAALVLALVLAALGCGPVLYTADIRAAELKLQQARDENARWYAPYEYYYAEANLRQARVEAAEASFEDAIRYAKTARDFSERALDMTQRRKQAER